MQKNISKFLILVVLNVAILVVAAIFIANQLSRTLQIVIISIILSSTTWGLVWFWQRRDRQDLVVMQQRMQSVIDGDLPRSVLVSADSDNWDLIRQFNDLQSYVRQQQHHNRRQILNYQTLLASLPVGVINVNHHHEINVFNETASRMLHMTTPILPVAEHLLIQQFTLSELISQTFNQKNGQRTILNLAIDGENKQYEATTFFQTDDEHTEVMVILYDLTTVLKVERMQADFLANASHEFKTPLTAITGFAETLQGSAGEDQSIREQFLQIISDETKKLTLLVNDVLSLSKIKHEPDRNTEERINLYMLVQEQWQSIQHLIIKHDIKLVNDIPDNFEVVTFKNDLTIIVKNLLANAVKYNRENGQVRLSAQKTSDHWSFSVRDTGIGIPTNQQARVFERFYRGDESRQKTIADGTGLGLAIVNELLAKHQGNIKLNSQVGVGTTFTVIFPNK